ncbi:MAG: SDR family oxidoreductase [Deltaproteobacteria bacterium]|nr:SDR family oxidoreductase [Deltaproteobacteria bacterium]
MTILVTGAGGTVGGYFAAHQNVFHEPLELVDLFPRPGIGALDIADLDAVRAKLVRGAYSHVVNLAAMTDVDGCEKSPELAYRANALGAWNVALAAREVGTVVVQVSTTSVLGGQGEGPFSELDEPHPVNVYARTKLEGERLVQRLCPESYVLRTAWIMGGGKNDKKFVGKVYEKLLAGHTIRAVNDEWGAPTYSKDFTLVCAKLLRTGAYGLYHVANLGRATRYDMAISMRRTLGSSSHVEPVSAEAFNLPAKRPRYDVPTSHALPARGITLRTWQEALEEYVITEIGDGARREQP